MDELEKNAWESFEMGFYDEVIHTYGENPENTFLAHLSLISRMEEGEIPMENKVEGESILLPIAESYLLYYSGRKNKYALTRYLQYLKDSTLPPCLVFFQFGVRLAFELEEYRACLHIMSRDRSGLNEEFYAKERIQCYYYLGMHAELIAYFKKFSQSIGVEISTYMKVGLSLQALGKFKESEKLLSQVPGTGKLPTYEEKKKELRSIIESIPELENKLELSTDEMRNLGFAYLFSENYKMAEETFKKATTLVAKV